MPASSSAECEAVSSDGEAAIHLPCFAFRVEEADVERYRRALGAPGARAPLGMALRALAFEAVMSALREAAGGRHPVHVAQEYQVERPLRAGVDYDCRIRVRRVADHRLRIEQRLSDGAGRPCLTLLSEVVLVAAA